MISFAHSLMINTFFSSDAVGRRSDVSMTHDDVLGTHTIRFRPVLNVSWKDLSKVLDVLKKGCAQLTAAASAAPSAAKL